MISLSIILYYTGGTSAPTTPTPCASGGFRCTDGSCIPSEWVCDDQDDCNDGLDEQNCGTG